MIRAVVMGVAGCGKSTVGQAMADAIGVKYRDGDDLHPAVNIAKMSAGTPLSDADRGPWLDQVGAVLAASDALIIGCSALKRVYRDRIRRAAPNTIFIHLSGSRAVIESRMSERQGHFMPVALLDSQFATLEPLMSDETGFSVNIDQGFADVVHAAFAGLERRE